MHQFYNKHKHVEWNKKAFWNEYISFKKQMPGFFYPSFLLSEKSFILLLLLPKTLITCFTFM